ncbi:SGNH/GDSL hydrolase family protein [Janthinobacterium sp. UMAB-60]|uniref:SGNH/GDSL hydrolase family protein n=1 Tax=Janthinobacterium sp. UMAB-60 TaxID=1365365 RepID=UPI001C563D05|nr:SGNH/GDSL hydrolase family protein [Janthinobacterium sp. UMAB-60]
MSGIYGGGLRLAFKKAAMIFDGESTNAPAAGGTGWVEVVKEMSAFKGQTFTHAAVPGRNMQATLADYAANVRPAILAAVAKGQTPLVFLQTGLNDYGLGPASNVTVPWDEYATNVAIDGGILVPMLTTRRFDWRGAEAVRQEINDHIRSKNYRMMIDTDQIFTDPNFSVANPQTPDGTHPNAPKNVEIATYVNQVVEAGSCFAGKRQAELLRPLKPSQIPITNYSGQLTTEGGITLDLATGGNKDFTATMEASFAEAGKCGQRWVIPGGVAMAYEWATIGMASNFHPELARSVTLFDLWGNVPLMSCSTYNQKSRLYGEWVIQRGGAGTTPEKLVSGCAYPVANNTPGKQGQIAYNPEKNKIAMYAGDGGENHVWVVCAATNVV